jgi:hypothetical protein
VVVVVVNDRHYCVSIAIQWPFDRQPQMAIVWWWWWHM